MRKALLLSVLVVWAAAPLCGADASDLLPEQFAGWNKQTPSQAGNDPRAADPTQPALLQEYGFTDFESATYARQERRIEVRAARFRDTSGAYGAFTFYRDPRMLSEDIGNLGGTADRHVLFYRGNLLVNVMLDKVTVMSAAELRELAAALPQASATDASSPPLLPAYLPKAALVANSARYVVGPVGLAAVAAPLPASLVDFSFSPEVVLGRYRTQSGEATMLLISYPTPQIAVQRFDSIRMKAAQATAAHGSYLMKTEIQAGMHVKRSGPIVVLVTAPASEKEALALLAAVNYDPEITWNERTPGPQDNIARLLIAIFGLVGVMLSFALVSGLAFGGLRVVAKRIYPDRFFDRAIDVDIIQLNLQESVAQGNEQTGDSPANSLDLGALARRDSPR